MPTGLLLDADGRVDAATPRLGELLLDRGVITQEQLEHALERAQRARLPLGSVLVSTGAVSRLALFGVLAEQWGLPFRRLTEQHSNVPFAPDADPFALLAAGIVPIRLDRVNGRPRLFVATSHRPTPGAGDLAVASVDAAVLGGHPAIEWVATTDWDITWTLRRQFEGAFDDLARTRVQVAHADSSAHVVLDKRQKWVLPLLAVVLIALFVWSPSAAMVAVMLVINAFFLTSLVFKLAVMLAGTRVGANASPHVLTDEELPTYTVLVPIYHEESIARDLVRSLERLDYPREKLQVLVLVEESDDGTRQAIIDARPQSHIQVLVVTEGFPKTKPKACNAGLLHATGELVVIYDAEDRPDPDQLRKAAAVFAAEGPELACVQAILRFDNAKTNWITRMFALEYSGWFDLMLPGMVRLGFPIPLGGTSNHFRASALADLGGWDPFNVTEDADLGMRAAAFGYRVGTLESTTYEEANSHLGNWVRQRSRWLKGYMQTTLVHLRHPLRMVHALGWRSVVTLVALIAGAPLTALVAPLLWVLTLAYVIWQPAFMSALFIPFSLALSLVTLISGNVLIAYLGTLAAFTPGRRELLGWSLTMPVYWLLMSLAVYKAAWQLVAKPFHWEKTNHGIDASRAAVPDAWTDGGSALEGAVA